MQARRDAGHQHLVPRHQRDRERDQAARIRDRPAFLLTRQCDAAPGNRPRRQNRQGRDRNLDAAAKKIGKIAVLVGVCPGFVGNRMLGQRQREAQKLVMEGAMPWDIDRVLYDFGFPMGPFAMSDLAGLDIGWVKEKSKGETIRDVLCEMDRRGQKTGAGYYDYDENRNAKPSPVTEKIIKDFVAKSGANPRQICDEEILERCIYPMINEGAKILEEGKAIRASDIDVVWVNGYGWPVYRGGPMWYGDQVGPDKVLAKMREWHQMGDAFKPSALLEQLVAENQKVTARR